MYLNYDRGVADGLHKAAKLARKTSDDLADAILSHIPAPDTWPRRSAWSDDEILRAQDLREAGMSAANIAQTLGKEYGTSRTKSAVIGCLWRLQQEAGK